MRSYSVHKDKQDLDDEVKVLLIFSKGAENRIKILLTIKDGLRNCHQIANKLNLDWWTVQRHLQHLEKASLVKNVGFGHIRFYKMTPKGELCLKSVQRQ